MSIGLEEQPLGPIHAETLARIPDRRELRSWLSPVAARDTALALRMVLLDVTLLAVAMGVAIAADHWALQMLGGVAAGLVIGRLFILGHDACHQSFTPHRRLNRWIGRIVFLPSLTPYSLWEVGHNVVHHGYTNLKGFDFVWEPMTLAEYSALPCGRRAIERIYRSGWGPWLYYAIEVWWRRMLFPNRRVMPTRRAVFTADGLLVSVFAVAWIAGLTVCAWLGGQSVAWLIGVAFVLPLFVWNGMIGFVVYVHHTHPGVAWHQDKKSWSATQPFVSTTVHLTFRSAMGSLLHHIMEHTAHHVDMSVPLYRLQQAQALLERKLPGRIVVQPFSWRWYADTARRCKLYDFESGCWTDFAGRPTSASLRA